jgi:hypothetical protein
MKTHAVRTSVQVQGVGFRVGGLGLQGVMFVVV